MKGEDVKPGSGEFERSLSDWRCRGRWLLKVFAEAAVCGII
jgi:hypothetical protein